MRECRSGLPMNKWASSVLVSHGYPGVLLTGSSLSRRLFELKCSLISDTYPRFGYDNILCVTLGAKPIQQPTVTSSAFRGVTLGNEYLMNGVTHYFRIFDAVTFVFPNLLI